MLQLFKTASEKLAQIWKQTVTSKLGSLLPTVWLGGLAIAVMAMWGFATIANEVLDRETDNIDTAILQSLQSLHSPLLNRVMVAITGIGDPGIIAAISGGLAVMLLWRRQWSYTIALAVTVGGATGLNFLLKSLFERDRPLLWERIVDASFHSFPSGHAMVSMAVYGLLGYWLMRRFPSWQILTFCLTVLLIAAIGFSRLYLGVHWPTDVVAGYAAGLVWLITCVLGFELAKIRFSSRNVQRKDVLTR